MNNSNLKTAHVKSLKILILQVFTLPLTIYRDTIYRFSNNIEEKESEFKVLQWITKCFDALIVLSYTLGAVIFLLILTTVIDGGEPIWSRGEVYAQSEIDYYEDYDDYLKDSQTYYSKKEFYEKKDRDERQRSRKHFDEEMFFALLAILYFLPLGLSFAKELWSIFWNIINRNCSGRLENIERNTDA